MWWKFNRLIWYLQRSSFNQILKRSKMTYVDLFSNPFYANTFMRIVFKKGNQTLWNKFQYLSQLSFIHKAGVYVIDTLLRKENENKVKVYSSRTEFRLMSHKQQQPEKKNCCHFHRQVQGSAHRKLLWKSEVKRLM